jgi:hypothetical protein
MICFSHLNINQALYAELIRSFDQLGFSAHTLLANTLAKHFLLHSTVLRFSMEFQKVFFKTLSVKDRISRAKKYI